MLFHPPEREWGPGRLRVVCLGEGAPQDPASWAWMGRDEGWMASEEEGFAEAPNCPGVSEATGHEAVCACTVGWGQDRGPEYLAVLELWSPGSLTRAPAASVSPLEGTWGAAQPAGLHPPIPLCPLKDPAMQRKPSGSHRSGARVPLRGPCASC